MFHAGLSQRVTKVSDAEQPAQIRRLEFAFNPESLSAVRRERYRPYPVEIIDRKFSVYRPSVPQNASALTRKRCLNSQLRGARPMQAQLHTHWRSKRIPGSRVNLKRSPLDSRRYNRFRVMCGDPYGISLIQHQMTLTHVGAGLNGQTYSFGENPRAAKVPKFAAAYVPQLPKSKADGILASEIPSCSLSS